MQDQRAELEWRDGEIPVSTRFDDPYYSLENGLEETRHVFLQGNDLPQRFRDGFAIAELGFGTGLNLLATMASWREADVEATLRFTSFEAYPMTRDEAARAMAAFGGHDEIKEALMENWPGGTGVQHLPGGVSLNLIVGDARKTLPQWEGAADAWFLDGFSPAKNPELWGEDILDEVARHTHPGGTVATYTAAGFVRRGLEAGGFRVERIPGYGRKRHMTKGVLAGR